MAERGGKRKGRGVPEGCKRITIDLPEYAATPQALSNAANAIYEASDRMQDGRVPGHTHDEGVEMASIADHLAEKARTTRTRRRRRQGQ